LSTAHVASAAREIAGPGGQAEKFEKLVRMLVEKGVLREAEALQLLSKMIP